MHPFIFMLVLSCIAAGVLGSAILARDPGQRANRLIATVLGCSAYWSLCEILWNLSDDPNTVLWMIRLSSFGWIPLGPLALDLFVEVTGRTRSRYHKVVPLAYSTAAFAIALYIVTPWCITAPIRVSWGWSYEFGPLFPLAFVPTILYVAITLVMWPRLSSNEISPGERHQVLWMFFGVLVPTSVASLTDVLLPYQGVHVPRLGSTSILAVGAIVAWSVRRYGYFLLVPGAFTQEILETLRDGVAMLQEDGRIRSCNDALARLVGAPQESLRGWPLREFLPDLPAGPGRGESRPRDRTLVHRRREDPGVRLVLAAARRQERGDRLRDRGSRPARGRDAAKPARHVRPARRGGRARRGHRPRDQQPRHVRAREPHAAAQRLEQSARPPRRSSIRRSTSTRSSARARRSSRNRWRGSTGSRPSCATSEPSPTPASAIPELVNVNELLENAVNVAALSFSVTVERCYSDLPEVRCAPQQLKQVFLNLLINAFQAIGDFGNIRLVTDSRSATSRSGSRTTAAGSPKKTSNASSTPSSRRGRSEKERGSDSRSVTRSCESTAARSAFAPRSAPERPSASGSPSPRRSWSLGRKRLTSLRGKRIIGSRRRKTSMTTPAAKLRALLDAPGLLLMPCCFDALSARLIERAGFGSPS